MRLHHSHSLGSGFCDQAHGPRKRTCRSHGKGTVRGIRTHQRAKNSSRCGDARKRSCSAAASGSRLYGSSSNRAALSTTTRARRPAATGRLAQTAGIMTPKKVRATLRKHFCDAGFVEDGPRFSRQSQELTHCVEVTAVRGLSGSIQIHHHVSLTGQAQPLLSEELASHGHHSTFPRIWSAASVDERLVLEQVTAIYRSFQTRQDIVHFFSDRYQHGDELGLPGALPPAPINSLSSAE